MIKYFLLLFFINICIFAQNGISRSYYPDGSIRSEISYVNDVLDGAAVEYYPNGNLKSFKEFSNGILHGKVIFYYPDGLIEREYDVKNGRKDGTERIYYSNGSLKVITVYESGKLIRRNRFDVDPQYKPLPEQYLAGNKQRELIKRKKQELICDAEICPVPIDGIESIQKNLVYPEHALLYGLEGEVILIATVDKEGNVRDVEVVKSLGLGCDEAAQEAVKKTKFIPGQTAGKPVESRVTLYVQFKIFDRTLAAKNPDVLNDEKNIEIQAPTGNLTKTEILCDNEECPYPKGGVKSINDNLEIPQIAKRLKLKGEIIIEAEINEFGIVVDTKILKGIGYGCDEAVESALYRTPFNPARDNGREVKSRVKIIFPFSYEG
ncbi:TonB family protein [Melioribacter roseus P3M-2]|uniref:TonB family protein n=1 Tax=Melioribacter roseus (strain DSM 23840 / JCM 17771 / VKM B-2668 / P3M-2) TaxID=1191523 RepID=I6YYL1_MELRP|nr:TonB family protein [Melioribacter roseus]AFN75657.1 TonB family protein [Melioribacter roseus P3M-2]